jgi:hypothetical protein
MVRVALTRANSLSSVQLHLAEAVYGPGSGFLEAGDCAVHRFAPSLAKTREDGRILEPPPRRDPANVRGVRAAARQPRVGAWCSARDPDRPAANRAPATRVVPRANAFQVMIVSV